MESARIQPRDPMNPRPIVSSTICRDLTVTTGDATSGNHGNLVTIESTIVGRDLTVITGYANNVLVSNESTTVGRR
jgi:hypothetical protein